MIGIVAQMMPAGALRCDSSVSGHAKTPPTNGTIMFAAPSARVARYEALAGLLFAVIFVVGVVASSPPNPDAPNAKWIADYTGHSNQVGHLVSGLALVVCGVVLMVFITGLWRRIAAQTPSGTPSPLPAIASAAAAASFVVGGLLMGWISGTELGGAFPLPSADLLRMSNELGFLMVGIGAMVSMSVALIGIAIQGHAAGLFGSKLRTATIVVGILVLAGETFVPVIIFVLWVAVVSIFLLRRPETVATEDSQNLATHGPQLTQSTAR
jgi:hypothetical protein